MSPDVRCFYGSGKVLPKDRVDIRTREVICNYTVDEAAEGNVMVTVNGVTSFGLPVESNHSSTDGKGIHDVVHNNYHSLFSLGNECQGQWYVELCIKINTESCLG